MVVILKKINLNYINIFNLKTFLNDIIKGKIDKLINYNNKVSMLRCNSFVSW